MPLLAEDAADRDKVAEACTARSTCAPSVAVTEFTAEAVELVLSTLSSSESETEVASVASDDVVAVEAVVSD